MKAQSPPQPQSLEGSSMFLGSSDVAISGGECSNAGRDVAKIVVQNYIYLPDIEVGSSRQDRAGVAGDSLKTARSPWPSINRSSRAKGTQDQETEDEKERYESAAASGSRRSCQPKLEPIADDIDLLYAGVVTSKRATRPKLQPIADDGDLLHTNIATSKRASQPKLETTSDDSDSDLLHTDVATSKRASRPKLEATADDSDPLYTDVVTSKRASQPKLEAIADVIDLLHTDVATNIQTIVKSETCTILPIDAGNLDSIPEIYTHHMLTHALGYPLYIPEPDHGLSREYRKRGVRIGDVGSITPEGAFDFLFNICLPAGHPINPPELPNDFEMLHTSDISIIPQFIAPGDCRYSDGVLELGDQLNKFHCTTSEGAVLLLPGGATLFKSKNTPIFQDFAARHAENWYKYMIDRGRNTPNGSLYLVTGCIKSRNWANATFYKGPSPGNYPQLVANDVPSSPALSNAQPAYRWKKLGKVSPRTGPISEETGELNQCEFLYGFKIMLRQDLLDKLSSTVSVSSQEGQYSPSPSTKASASNGDRGGNGASTNTKEEPHLEEGDAFRSHNSCFSGEVIIEADFPTAPPLHPSDLINFMLLQSDPSAKVAITHDAVWCETLLKFATTRSDFTMGDMVDAIAERYSSTTDKFDCISLAGKIRGAVNAYEDHCDDVEKSDATSDRLKNDTSTPNISDLDLVESVADAPLENKQIVGDHKCPVCLATFTRPQHVARHMRSHTGDRPYKCLYCGDQFARSDRLSRHCNKYHANEKPLPNSGSRRRGSALAVRAATSKQACDQCVQSSLPCDGSNPCAKCVQRKCRCTYVKFRRQTAPVGPGHSSPRPGTAGNALSSIGGVNSSLPNISSSSRMPMYSHIDDFLLGQQQPLAPSMPDNLFSQSLGFPPLYSRAADPSQPIPPLTDNTDLGPPKFRQHPDPYRRESLPVSNQAFTATPGAGLMPGLYAYPPHTSNWMTWGQENDPSFITTNHHSEAIHSTGFSPTGEGPHSHYADHRDRRRTSDYTNEGSSTSQSVPSSAISSSVRLPMENMNLHHQSPSDHPQTYPLVAALHHDRAYTTRVNEGGFSSAFGLMSLDDPNVLAGLASDGAPFFSDNAMTTLGPDDPNQTPMPAKQLDAISKRSNAGPAPSKEASTPLSGSRPMGSAAAEAPGPQPQRHASTSRRPRVASLPNTKSPFSVEHAQSQRKDENNPTSSIRTPLHRQEDLRLFEAAVLARKTPTTLRLGPRARRNNTISTSSASPSLTPSPQVPTLQIDSNLNYSYSPGSNGPSSATGPPMMASWSGKLPPVRLGYPHDTLSTSSPPSRESSLSIDDGTGSGGSDREGMRPSCKRLPSQTLGPPNTKRVQVSHEELGGRPSSTSSSGVPVPVYNYSSGVVPDDYNATVNPRPSIPVAGGGYVELGRPPSLTEMHPSHAQLHHVERPIANLEVDRHRKMSAPTMTHSMPAFTFVAPPGPGPGANT